MSLELLKPRDDVIIRNNTPAYIDDSTVGVVFLLVVTAA